MKLRFRENAYDPKNFNWYVRESKVGDFGDVHIKAKDDSEMFLEMRNGICHVKYGCYWTWHDDGLPVEPQEASGSIREMLSLFPASEEEIAEAEEKILRYFSIFPSYRNWEEDVFIIRKSSGGNWVGFQLEKHTGKEIIELEDETFFRVKETMKLNDEGFIQIKEETTYTVDYTQYGTDKQMEKICIDKIQALCDGKAKIWDIEDDFGVGRP